MLPPRLFPALRPMALWIALLGAVAAFALPDGPAGAQSHKRGPAEEPKELPQEAANERERTRLDVESIAGRQASLLDQAFAGLHGSSLFEPPQLYFLGFAGYGPQAVFKREALAVQALFDARFGTRDRSLVLVNHDSTANDIALASPENLDRALQRLGRVMNKEVDTLFLFLTSHGRKGLLAVEMPGFDFEALTPADLKAMLDRSQIKNRVIVISACHSGSFAPALAGPTSLVIAAAHAERTSFGCEDRREWTYFGDAFFNRALRKERSFARAFERARRLIDRWETSEGLARSLPQIAGGKALQPRLDEIARSGTVRE